MPGIKGADGKIIRWSNIGGQPFVLMTWNTDTQTKEALDFVKWWLSKDIQNAFAAGGGQSAIKSVYNDPKYVTYRPWNRAWAPSLDWQKDIWHVPEFFELLVAAAGAVRPAITGKQDAKTTLDNIADLPGKAPEGSRPHRGLTGLTDGAGPAVRRRIRPAGEAKAVLAQVRAVPSSERCKR